MSQLSKVCRIVLCHKRWSLERYQLYPALSTPETWLRILRSTLSNPCDWIQLIWHFRVCCLSDLKPVRRRSLQCVHCVQWVHSVCSEWIIFAKFCDKFSSVCSFCIVNSLQQNVYNWKSVLNRNILSVAMKERVFLDDIFLSQTWFFSDDICLSQTWFLSDDIFLMRNMIFCRFEV